MNKKYQPQIVPRKQNANWVFMRLALCTRGLCTDCQGCSVVKQTLATCAAAYEDCRRSEMYVLIAFHWLCLTQGHSVTQ